MIGVARQDRKVPITDTDRALRSLRQSCLTQTIFVFGEIVRASKRKQLLDLRDAQRRVDLKHAAYCLGGFFLVPGECMARGGDAIYYQVIWVFLDCIVCPHRGFSMSP